MEACLAETCTSAAAGSSAVIFTQLIQTLLTAQCSIRSQQSYPVDRTNEVVQHESFDFIIVGGGSAGSVVASRLSENPDWRVLLIERGTDPSFESDIPAFLLYLQGSEEDYQYKVEPDEKYCQGIKNQQCIWAKGKALGGSSVINAMLYIRGNDRDFDQWAQMGNDGWSYEDVLPYFLKVENYHPDIPEKYGDHLYGTGGPLTLRPYNYSDTGLHDVLQGAIEDSGLPMIDMLNGEEYVGFGKAFGNVDAGIRQNVAKAYLSLTQGRDNLYIMKSARADSVIFDGKKAVGVRVTLNDGQEIDLKASKEVILSAGSIATPQILMLSGIGPKDELVLQNINVIADLPVGKNLQDHLIWLGVHLTYINRTATPPSPTFMLDWAYEYLVQRKGEFASAGGVDLVGFVNTKDSEAKYPNIEFHFTQLQQYQQFKMDALTGAFKLEDELREQLRNLNQESEVIFSCPVLLNPQSAGHLKLRSTDPEDQIEIHANYFDVQEDIDVMIEALDVVRSLLDTKTFKELGVQLQRLEIPACGKYATESRDYWECNLKHTALTIFHPVGTCKMGSVGSNDSVVDPNLKVHNIQGLRVIDASIMPKITSGNTHAPTLMIAEKGSDLIKTEWLVKDEL